MEGDANTDLSEGFRLHSSGFGMGGCGGCRGRVQIHESPGFGIGEFGDAGDGYPKLRL